MESHAWRASKLDRRSTVRRMGVLGLLSIAYPAGAFAAPAATPDLETNVSDEVSMPDWRFSLVDVTDPYSGDLSRPDTIGEDDKIVACQIILTNLSDQPMEFTIRDVRLRDDQGIEYPAGDVIGAEPRVVSQNLPNGERTRGWVWFAIPDAHDIESVVFVPPRPVLKITL